MNKNLKNRLITVALAAACLMPLGAQASAFNRAQMDEIAAPIALYPDSLLGSVLAASTYPDQVIDAYNWTVNYQALTQGQKESLVASMGWDDSVKTLALIPETLEMMVNDMEWTDRLSQAFVTQQDSLCVSIQGLRRRARMNGALRDSNYIRVVDADNIIMIQPANSAYTAVPVYSAAVYNYSPAQTVFNTVLSWSTVRILDSIFYGGAWDWHHHRVYMGRGHHRYTVPPSVVPPYKPQFHPPARHTHFRPEPPKPIPAAHRPEPPRPAPIAHNPQPHRPAPIAHRPEPPRPAPTAHHPQPHKSAPIAHSPQPGKPAPTAHHPQPPKSAPIAHSPQPHKSAPIAHSPQPHKPASIAHNPQPHKAAPIAHNPQPHKSAPEQAGPQSHKPAPAVQRPQTFKPVAAAQKPQAHSSAPSAHRPQAQTPSKGAHASSDKGRKSESRHGSKPDDKKHRR